MNGGIIFCLTFIVLWCCAIFTVAITAHLVEQRGRRKQCEKDNALSVSTPSETMKRKTNTAKIAQELVTLDHALMEMTANEILRVRTREESETRDH